MHALHLVCRCGHRAEVRIDLVKLRGETREQTLARARCTACGRKGATDLRLLWLAGDGALEGARTQQQIGQ